MASVGSPVRQTTIPVTGIVGGAVMAPASTANTSVVYTQADFERERVAFRSVPNKKIYDLFFNLEVYRKAQSSPLPCATTLESPNEDYRLVGIKDTHVAIRIYDQYLRDEKRPVANNVQAVYNDIVALYDPEFYAKESEPIRVKRTKAINVAVQFFKPELQKFGNYLLRSGQAKTVEEARDRLTTYGPWPSGALVNAVACQMWKIEKNLFK